MTVPFNSERKRMTTAVRLENGKVRVFVKGTPAVMMPACNYFYDKDQTLCRLTDEKKEQILSANGVIGAMADQSLRTLLIGFVDYEQHDWEARVKSGVLDSVEGKDSLE